MFDTCLMQGLGFVFITLHGLLAFAKGFAFCLFIKGRPKSVRQLGTFKQGDTINKWMEWKQPVFSFRNARSYSKSQGKATCTISIWCKRLRVPAVNHQFRSSVDSNVADLHIFPPKKKGTLFMSPDLHQKTTWLRQVAYRIWKLRLIESSIFINW